MQRIRANELLSLLPEPQVWAAIVRWGVLALERPFPPSAWAKVDSWT